MIDNIFNTYEGDMAIYGDFEVPVPTWDMTKKIDFNIKIKY